MKFSIAALSLLSAVAIAAPAPSYEEDCDETVEAPKYEHKQAPKYEAKPEAPKYEAPKYESGAECPKTECPATDYPVECPVTECPVAEEKEDFPIKFTSKFSIVATPDQVVSMMNVPTGGLAGAVGYYSFGINSDINTICYNITLVDVTGEYQSPADTATHIHQSDLGMSGPPRIAFPNPTIVDGSNIRQSFGCLTAPFVTGIEGADGVTDTGSASGFTLADIEANPSAFNADVHTADAVPGAVRGQFGEPL